MIMNTKSMKVRSYKKDSVYVFRKCICRMYFICIHLFLIQLYTFHKCEHFQCWLFIFHIHSIPFVIIIIIQLLGKYSLIFHYLLGRSNCTPSGWFNIYLASINSTSWTVNSLSNFVDIIHSLISYRTHCI